MKSATYDRSIKEYDLENLEIEVPRVEMLSLFGKLNGNKDFYLGRDLSEIFRLRNRELESDLIYIIESDMLNLAINFKKGNEIQHTVDFMGLGYDKQVDILKKIMDKNKTKFLVSYLGNIIKR